MELNYHRTELDVDFTPFDIRTNRLSMLNANLVRLSVTEPKTLQNKIGNRYQKLEGVTPGFYGFLTIHARGDSSDNRYPFPLQSTYATLVGGL